MMKSFFKKLAFVMALAMVVTTAAPAANVFAAAFGIVAQNDATWTVVESVNVEVEEKADFKFVGAPSNWKDLGFVWTSSNEDVATVNQAGVVTGVADGVATITLADAAATYVATLEVTVGEGEVVVDNSYTYKQISHNTATFTFNHDVEYTLADVTLTKVFAGGYEVNWPIETFKCEKNVVTVKPYVEFADGDEYIIHIGAEDAGTAFTTTIGEVDYIELGYKSLDQDGVAYAKLDEDDEDIEVTLYAKLFSNGVDVTKAAGYNKGEFTFELVEESDDFDISNDNILVFDKPGVVAVVEVIYETEDANGEEVVKRNSAPVAGIPAPRYTIVSVDKWTIANEKTLKTYGLQIDWNGTLTHDLPAFDENDDQIVLLMTDSYGNKIVYPNEFAKYSKKVGNAYPVSLKDLQTKSNDAYVEASEDFEIHYTSTNPNKVFVGTKTGDITTLGTSSAPIIISLYDENDDDDLVLVKNISACPLEVTGRRVIDKVTATLKFDELLVDTYGYITGSYVQGKVVFKVVDQYGAPYGDVKVSIVDDSKKLDIKETTAKGTDTYGETSYTFNGSQFVDKDGKVVSSATFIATVQDPNTKAKETVKFKISTETPDYIKDAAGKVIGVKTEDYELYADSKDMKLKNSEKGVNISSGVKFYETSNGMNIKLANSTLVANGSAYLKDTTGAFSIPSDETKVDNLYIVVYGPDGKALSAAATTNALEAQNDGSFKATVYGNAGSYQVALATASGSAMQYAKTGTYTVKGYLVTEIDYTDSSKKTPSKEAAEVEEFEYEFTVKNTSATVSFKSQDVIDFTTLESDDTKKITNLNKLIFKAFNFNLGSAGLNEDVTNVAWVDARYNADSGYFFIYGIVFDVKLDNAEDAYTYSSGYVTVNKSLMLDDNAISILKTAGYIK